MVELSFEPLKIHIIAVSLNYSFGNVNNNVVKALSQKVEDTFYKYSLIKVITVFLIDSFFLC